MKVLLQRVKNATVTVNKEIISNINTGLLLFVGMETGDTETQIIKLAKKTAHLRVFPDANGRFHYSLLEIKGEALVVSQFTLCAETQKGRRPDFFKALEPELAKPMIKAFANELKAIGVSKVGEGSFGADMDISLVNNGPVTIMLEA